MRKIFLAGITVGIVFIILFRYYFGRNDLLVGDKVPHIAFTDMTGRSISIDEFDDRYVIIDFWGSWCIPCRSSNKKLVQFYEKQDTSLLKIISIGVEKDKKKWKNAIQEDSLFWDEQFTPLGMFTNQITDIYGVEVTPTYFLVNPDQKIIAKSGSIDYIIDKYHQHNPITSDLF